MTAEERRRIAEVALQTYGSDAQVFQLVEEVGELLVAVNHFRRGRVGPEVVAGEIADVLNMLEQLRMVIGYASSEIEELRDAKLTRQYARLVSKGAM